jgi:FAD dependent oxidoreductase
MVGVSVALHLQRRGRDVALIDRRGAGEETSYGNAGLIQREAVIPYTFPREFGVVLSYAMNNRRDAVYHLPALPRIAPLREQARRCHALSKSAVEPEVIEQLKYGQLSWLRKPIRQSGERPKVKYSGSRTSSSRARYTAPGAADVILSGVRVYC